MSSGQVRRPARRRDDPRDLAVLGHEDVPVDHQVGDAVDRAIGGQPPARPVRVARPVAGRIQDHDVLLGRVDDVQLVERGVEVGHEGRQVRDVVAPGGRVADRDPDQRPPARVVGRPPAPERVLAVEDQHVRAAEGQELGVGDAGARRPLARAQDGGRLLLREVDPPDRLAGRVQHVRRAVGAAHEAGQLDRLVLGEREQRRRLDVGHAVQAVEARERRLAQRLDLLDRVARLLGGVELLVGGVQQLERLARVVGDEVDAGPAHAVQRLLGGLERALGGRERRDGVEGLALAADGVDAERRGRRRRPRRRAGPPPPGAASPSGTPCPSPSCWAPPCAAAACPGSARSRARSRCPRRSWPWSPRRRSPPRSPSTVSASGIGDLSGAPASGSAGRTGTSVLALCVAPTSLASNARAPSLPLPSAATNRAWRCSIADCGWSVTSASLRASVPILATMFADTRHSESPTVELAAPDLGLEVLDRQAAIAVGVGQGGQAGLADQVRLGRADRRHVQLAAADHGHRDADRPAVVALVAHPVAVALVGEPLVGDAHHLGQALPDAGRLVVVVLVADRVGDHPRRLARAVAGGPRRDQQVQVALRPCDGADGRLDDHDGVGRVGELVLLGDGTELQLETDGQATSLMVGATRVGMRR